MKRGLAGSFRLRRTTRRKRRFSVLCHTTRIQMQMRFIFHGSEVLETAQGLEVDLPVILTSCPASLRVRTGIEKHAVGVAP